MKKSLPINKFTLKKKKLTPSDSKISVLKTSLISSLLFTLPFLLLTVSSSSVHAGLSEAANKNKLLGTVVGGAAVYTAGYYYKCASTCSSGATHPGRTVAPPSIPPMCVQTGPGTCAAFNGALALTAAGVAIDTFRSVMKRDKTKKDITSAGGGNGNPETNNLRHSCTDSQEFVGMYMEPGSSAAVCAIRKDAEWLEREWKKCAAKGTCSYKEELCEKAEGCYVRSTTKGYENKFIYLKKGERLISSSHRTLVFRATSEADRDIPLPSNVNSINSYKENKMRRECPTDKGASIASYYSPSHPDKDWVCAGDYDIKAIAKGWVLKPPSEVQNVLCAEDRGCQVLSVTEGYEKTPISLKKGERLIGNRHQTYVLPANFESAYSSASFASSSVGLVASAESLTPSAALASAESLTPSTALASVGSFTSPSDVLFKRKKRLSLL